LSLYFGNDFKNFSIAFSAFPSNFPPEALVCPPPEKNFSAKRLLGKVPKDLNDILTLLIKFTSSIKIAQKITPFKVRP